MEPNNINHGGLENDVPFNWVIFRFHANFHACTRKTKTNYSDATQLIVRTHGEHHLWSVELHKSGGIGFNIVYIYIHNTTYMLYCIYTYIHMDVRTYVRTYIHAYMHTYIGHIKMIFAGANSRISVTHQQY